jgi:hypothetical protein
MAEIAQQQITALEKIVGTDAKSPLFAQLADFYLESHRAEDALRMCDAGLAHYPFYTTGHLVKGKALVVLHMRAEARREFEFVLEFLPHNEVVASLLEQIPPSEDETLTVATYEVEPKPLEPEDVPPSLNEYRIIPSPPQLQPEPGYSFSGFDQPVQEQQPEVLSPAPTSLSGPSFFDAITQTPAAATMDDLLGFAAPSAETPAIPDPSSFNGFDVPMSEPPSFAETQASAFADIPRSVPEPSSETGFTLSAPNQEELAEAPSEEESFALYASRRRSELTGEDTLSLEDYLSNVFIVSSEEIPLELPTFEGLQSKIDDTPVKENFSANETIVLPKISPPDLPLSDNIQNQIEEIANKLQGAKKITPVIDYVQKETPPASEQDLPVSIGFVTPTLAEIYAKQGWYDDAIKAYKALAHNKPAEKERFEKRIEELEKLKSQNSK